MSASFSRTSSIARRDNVLAIYEYFAPRLRALLVFGGGQIGLQAVAALSGIVLVRWMSIEAYSKLGLALTFQFSMGLLVELGLGSAVIALIGVAAEDPDLLGRYLKSALYLRTRLLAAVCVLTAGLVAFTGYRQHWSFPEQILIFIGVCGGLYTQLGLSLYGLPLIVRRNLRPYYAVQIGVALVRLGLIIILALVSALNAEMVMLAGSGAGFVGMFVLRYLGRTYCRYPERPDPQVTMSLIRYIAPLIPGVLYISLQGQVAMVVVSYFGLVQPVAEVAALARLGQLFALLTAFNAIVIGPAVAKIEDVLTLTNFYRRAVTGAVLLGGTISVLAIWLPEPLLWLLGPKYAQLRSALRLVVASSCINYLSSVLWSIHAARAWVFWWATWLFIGFLFMVQVFGVLLLPVETTIGASQLGLITSVAVLFVHICVGAYGFRRHWVAPAESQALA
jgi:O-antigen/teichoic acid export membrane protein